jgi:hypothetical protein
VTVDATSTIWVDAAGSVVSAPSSNSNQNTLALGLGLGLGLGIPLVLAVVGFGAWICIRRRRRRPLWNPNAVPLPPAVDEPAGAQSPIPRKPVTATASRTQNLSSTPETRELEGGRGVHRELGGTGLHPFPDRVPGPPVLVPGHHELHNVGRQTELPGGPPPQYYQPAAVNPGTPTGRDRWEMP